MPFNGTLRTWHDDRGFGFIAPTHGGAEVFVHISAFPRDGSRPTQGEQLRYELGRGRNGEVQAVGVTRSAVGTPPSPSPSPSPPPPPALRRDGRPAPRSRWPLLVVVLALGFAAVLGYGQLRRPAAVPDPAPQPLTAPDAAAPDAGFRCDGRQHCSQMNSCAEATFFLKHCPGVKMDGNHDGVPCEEQWCRR